MIQTGGHTLFCVRVMEKISTGFCWGSRAVISLEVTMTVSAGGPIFCFVVLLKSLCVCVSLFYVIDTGSIGSRARIEMGVTYLPSASIQYILKLFHRGHCSSIDGVLAYIIVPPE